MSKGVQEALVDLLALVDEIRQVTPDQSNGLRAKISKDCADKFEKILDFFTVIDGDLETVALRQEDAQGLSGLSPNEIAALQRTRDELEKSRAEFADLEARQAEIAAELDARGDLVEATRTKTGAAGAKELAAAYEEQARSHSRQWKLWGVGLVLSTVIALVVGYLVLHHTHPEKNATAAQIVSRVTVDLLVVGLLIYAVRVTSRQFSVHSHLATVAHNKAAALATFSRIVTSGSSPEARDRLADVLAQYVFASDNTGFLSGDGDQVTLLERIAGPLSQRLGQSS
jgi:hypothetical protein